MKSAVPKSYFQYNFKSAASFLAVRYFILHKNPVFSLLSPFFFSTQNFVDPRFQHLVIFSQFFKFTLDRLLLSEWYGTIKRSVHTNVAKFCYPRCCCWRGYCIYIYTLTLARSLDFSNIFRLY